MDVWEVQVENRAGMQLDSQIYAFDGDVHDLIEIARADYLKLWEESAEELEEEEEAPKREDLVISLSRLYADVCEVAEMPLTVAKDDMMFLHCRTCYGEAHERNLIRRWIRTTRWRSFEMGQESMSAASVMARSVCSISVPPWRT